MKDKYMLEIYYPTGSGGSNMVHFKSDTPFQTISQGDIVDTSELPDADTTGELRVTSVTHLVWTPPKSDESLHRIRIHTAARKGQITMLYKIIEGYSPDQMYDYAQELLDEGWALHGNLSVRTYLAEPIDVLFKLGERITVYTQTLVKEETPAETDARVNYLDNLLLKPIDQLTPEERKTREEYLEDLADEDAEPS
jgi:hypothetical protein